MSFVISTRAVHIHFFFLSLNVGYNWIKSSSKLQNHFLMYFRGNNEWIILTGVVFTPFYELIERTEGTRSQTTESEKSERKRIPRRTSETIRNSRKYPARRAQNQFNTVGKLNQRNFMRETRGETFIC